MTKFAKSLVQLDNARIRVTEWRFEPGDATGPHRHGMDYVVLPLSNGTLKLVNPDGSDTFASLTAGRAYYRDAGVEHDVINASPHEVVFIEIEMK